MAKKIAHDETPPVVEDRRAPDQDAAIEVAFVEGTLPEEDRRAPESVSVEGPLVEAADEATQEIQPTQEAEPVMENDVLNAVLEREDGVKTDGHGHVLT